MLERRVSEIIDHALVANVFGKDFKFRKNQRKIKGSKEFMNEEERIFILNQLKIVDKTFISIDKDRSVCETIKLIHNKYSLPSHHPNRV